MIDANTQVIAVPPRISADRFSQILKAANSPAYAESLTAYAAIVAEGVDPLFLLSIFQHESGLGKLGFGAANKSPGNTRTTLTGEGFPVQTVKGTFIRYKNWTSGFKDLARRLSSKDYVYAKAGAVTISQILPIFAPASDGNSPESYIAAVVKSMSEWIGEKGVSMIDPSVSRLIPGHAGRGRGNAKPELIVMHVQEGLNDLPSYFASVSDDSTVWSTQDGQAVRMLYDTDTPYTNGNYNKPNLANPVIKQHYQAGDYANGYCLTIEHQGYYKTGFTAAQIEATCQMTAYWCSLWGIPADATHIVGHRDFDSVTRANCPGPNFPFANVISRVNEILANSTLSHTTDNAPPKPAGNGLPPGMEPLDNPNNLAIYEGAFLDTITGKQVIQPFARFYLATGSLARYGRPISGLYGSTPGAQEMDFQFFHFYLNDKGVIVAEAKPDVIQMNNFTVGHGMLDYWRKLDIPGVPHPLGLPISNEFDWADPSGQKQTVQVFERGALGYNGAIADPAYRVQGLLIGADWLKGHKVTT